MSRSVILQDIETNRSSGALCCLILVTYRIGRWLLLMQRSRGSRALRHAFRLVRIPVSVVYKLLQTLSRSSLPFSASLGRGVLFPHGLAGVFVSSDAHVGNDVVILHHVTIGSNFGSDKTKAAPLIGDRVFIGAGAKIIGGVAIGEAAKIGANAVIVNDVPGGGIFAAPAAVCLGKK